MADLNEIILAVIFVSSKSESNNHVSMSKVMDSLGITTEETVQALKALIRAGFVKRLIPRHHSFFLKEENVREFPAQITPAGIEYLAWTGAEKILKKAEKIKKPYND